MGPTNLRDEFPKENLILSILEPSEKTTVLGPTDTKFCLYRSTRQSVIITTSLFCENVHNELVKYLNIY